MLVLTGLDKDMTPALDFVSEQFSTIYKDSHPKLTKFFHLPTGQHSLLSQDMFWHPQPHNISQTVSCVSSCRAAFVAEPEYLLVASVSRYLIDRLMRFILQGSIRC